MRLDQYYKKTFASIEDPLKRLAKWTYAVLRSAVEEFLRLRSFEAGAGMAYYALFSLFPLLIFLISILGFILEQDRVQTEVLALLKELFPIAKDSVTRLIEQNLGTIFERRGSVSIFAAIGLLWAGSNVFTAMVRNINLAWHTKTHTLTFLRYRLSAMGIITVLAIVIILSFLSTPLINLLARFSVPFGHGKAISETGWWMILLKMPFYFTSFVLFVALYYWVPKTKVRWREAFGGAVVATVGLRLAINGFTWSIKKGLLNYQVIYGSLAT
ncbi:MAG: YihY/virulence factor BrkB family protein, partial [Candidatus Latescibacterota bacterium]